MTDDTRGERCHHENDVEGEAVLVYMPSHWRETIKDQPRALIGFFHELNEHDADVEEWEQVAVFRLRTTDEEG